MQHPIRDQLSTLEDIEANVLALVNTADESELSTLLVGELQDVVEDVQGVRAEINRHLAHHPGALSAAITEALRLFGNIAAPGGGRDAEALGVIDAIERQLQRAYALAQRREQSDLLTQRLKEFRQRFTESPAEDPGTNELLAMIGQDLDELVMLAELRRRDEVSGPGHHQVRQERDEARVEIAKLRAEREALERYQRGPLGRVSVDVEAAREGRMERMERIEELEEQLRGAREAVRGAQLATEAAISRGGELVAQVAEAEREIERVEDERDEHELARLEAESELEDVREQLSHAEMGLEDAEEHAGIVELENVELREVLAEHGLLENVDDAIELPDTIIVQRAAPGAELDRERLEILQHEEHLREATFGDYTAVLERALECGQFKPALEAASRMHRLREAICSEAWEEHFDRRGKAEDAESTARGEERIVAALNEDKSRLARLADERAKEIERLEGALDELKRMYRGALSDRDEARRRANEHGAERDQLGRELERKEIGFKAMHDAALESRQEVVNLRAEIAANEPRLEDGVPADEAADLRTSYGGSG